MHLIWLLGDVCHDIKVGTGHLKVPATARAHAVMQGIGSGSAGVGGWRAVLHR